MKTIPVYWWQNIQEPETEPLLTTAVYSPAAYQTFDNYSAINVNKVKEIPNDYFGVMGVPYRFLRYWNAKDWEIVGLTVRWNDACRVKRYTKEDAPNWNDLNANPVLMTEDGLKQIYQRILIRRKQ